MKRVIVLTLIIILLLTLNCIILINGIHIGSLNIDSIGEIRAKSDELNKQLADANTAVSITYPEKEGQVSTAIKQLNKVKEEYEVKTQNEDEVKNTMATQTKYYEIDYLYTKLGMYATDENVTLTMTLEKTGTEDDIYRIKFTVEGEYIGITNCIYHIENDENLKFKIKNFKLEPKVIGETQSKSGNAGKNENKNSNTVANNKTNTTSGGNTATTTNKTGGSANNTGSEAEKKLRVDTTTLVGSFIVEDVGIRLE